MYKYPQSESHMHNTLFFFFLVKNISSFQDYYFLLYKSSPKMHKFSLGNQNDME